MFNIDIEFGFSKIIFPIHLYSKVGICHNNINVAITIKDLDLNTNGVYESSPLNILAGAISEEIIYKIKENPYFLPSKEYFLMENMI